MKILEKLTEMDDEKIRDLEINAERMLATGSEDKKHEASQVMQAIERERQRRDAARADELRAVNEKIAQTVKHLDLRARVERAFREMPPRDNEIDTLNAIAANPGKDINALGRILAYADGAYVNLVVGGLCKAREVYLGQAPMSSRREGEKNYATLIVDMERCDPADRAKGYGWTLKPEALVGLRALGIVK